MPQLLDRDSAESTNSLLDLFSVPPTQTVVDSSYWYAAHPINTITSDGPYSFIVPAGPDYMQLGKNYMYMKLKIVKPDGSAIDGVTAPGSDRVGPINLLGKTFWRQLKVDINGKSVYDSGSMYAYRSYLETELNYNSECKDTFLTTALYDKDTPAQSVETVLNTGWQKRIVPFQQSKVVEMLAPLHCDLFVTDRVLLSNTQLQLQLHRNSDKFALMCFNAAPPAYKIEVVELVWYVKMLIVSPTVHMGIESTLAKMPAKYPLRRIAMTKLSIAAGRQNAPQTPIFDGQVPRRLIIGFVGTANYYGHYGKSPFLFHNHSVREIAVHAGGRMYPREPLKVDYESNFYKRAYTQLVDTLGLLDDNRSNNIDLEDYTKSMCLYGFDLTPDDCENTQWELVKEGSTNVCCIFNEPVPEPGLEMIVYAEFDNLMMIDRFRSVYFDYSV